MAGTQGKVLIFRHLDHWQMQFQDVIYEVDSPLTL